MPDFTQLRPEKIVEFLQYIIPFFVLGIIIGTFFNRKKVSDLKEEKKSLEEKISHLKDIEIKYEELKISINDNDNYWALQPKKIIAASQPNIDPSILLSQKISKNQ